MLWAGCWSDAESVSPQFLPMPDYMSTDPLSDNDSCIIKVVISQIHFALQPRGTDTSAPDTAMRDIKQELTSKPTSLHTLPRTIVKLPPVDILEIQATKGEWTVPAVEEVSLGLTLSNVSVSWRGLRGTHSEEVSIGTVAICEFNQSRSFEMRHAAKFAIVSLRNEIWEQAAYSSRYLRPELKASDVLQDLTLRHLMEILLREQRSGFLSGSFFLDGVTTAMASYLLRHYAVASPARQSSAGGMAPSILRRCIEFMEARLEGDLRLSDLAREAGMSTSHFIRSFRQSTGKTPHQFLLHQRVERAQSLMHDRRSPLTEVALASGFADQHHLARIFRRITGVTPSSYRRSL
jgi:AraC family transcriptional regulator